MKKSTLILLAALSALVLFSGCVSLTCGDGVCVTDFENATNCPEDCGPDPIADLTLKAYDGTTKTPLGSAKIEVSTTLLTGERFEKELTADRKGEAKISLPSGLSYNILVSKEGYYSSSKEISSLVPQEEASFEIMLEAEPGQAVCGNKSCESRETKISCPEDCKCESDRECGSSYYCISERCTLRGNPTGTGEIGCEDYTCVFSAAHNNEEYVSENCPYLLSADFDGDEAVSIKDLIEMNKLMEEAGLECRCGNGVCGTGEDFETCPLDCKPKYSDELDIRIITSKSIYAIGEIFSGEYYLKYNGPPFDAVILYCKSRSGFTEEKCAIKRGRLDNIWFEHEDMTGNLKVPLTAFRQNNEAFQDSRTSFPEQGSYSFKMSVFSCDDVAEKLEIKCRNANENNLKMANPLKYLKRTVKVIGPSDYNPPPTEPDETEPDETEPDETEPDETEPELFCGDGACNNSETPTSCTSDCGCPSDGSCDSGFLCLSSKCVEEGDANGDGVLDCDDFECVRRALMSEEGYLQVNCPYIESCDFDGDFVYGPSDWSKLDYKLRAIGFDCQNEPAEAANEEETSECSLQFGLTKVYLYKGISGSVSVSGYNEPENVSWRIENEAIASVEPETGSTTMVKGLSAGNTNIIATDTGVGSNCIATVPLEIGE